jgi:(S)-2-hydroxyglutarate dehydrogenase
VPARRWIGHRRWTLGSVSSPAPIDVTSGSAAGQYFDAVVVGAGILGLATAREWLQRVPGLRLAVLDKETAIAFHQTGRNSGVIHSGIYYAPGSLKASLCVSGARRLKVYCHEHAIPFERTGKLIIATREEELAGLEELFRRGRANGVPEVEMVGEGRIGEIEPHARGIAAVYCPDTAIVDYRHIAEALAGDVEGSGGRIQTAVRVDRIKRASSKWHLQTTTGPITTRWLITCAGLQSDLLAVMTGGSPSPRILPFRGDYLLLRPERRTLVRGLIYPVPDHRFPFLGVHATKRIDGQVLLGPNAVLAFAREGYRFAQINPRELFDTVRSPAFRRLATTYWKTGLAELGRDLSVAAFVKEVRRYVPSLQVADAVRGPSGVRAQAVSADGRLIDDFAFSEAEGALHVRNAPSPAATACLAIASHILDRFLGNLGN